MRCWKRRKPLVRVPEPRPVPLRKHTSERCAVYWEKRSKYLVYRAKKHLRTARLSCCFPKELRLHYEEMSRDYREMAADSRCRAKEWRKA